MKVGRKINHAGVGFLVFNFHSRALQLFLIPISPPRIDKITPNQIRLNTRFSVSSEGEGAFSIGVSHYDVEIVK